LKMPGELAPSRKNGAGLNRSPTFAFASDAPSGNGPGNIPLDAAAFGPRGEGTRFPRIPPLGLGASGKSPCRIPPDGKASGATCRAGKFPRMPPAGGVDSNEAVSTGLANAAVPACEDGGIKPCNHQGSAARVWGAGSASSCVVGEFHSPNAGANPYSSASDGMISPSVWQKSDRGARTIRPAGKWSPLVRGPGLAKSRALPGGYAGRVNHSRC